MSKTSCRPAIREFGEELREFLLSTEGQTVLPMDSEESWTRGGCWVLAEALNGWLGEEASIWAIWNMTIDGIDHMVVRIGNCYLDGDGAWSRSELLQRIQKISFGGRVSLRRFNAWEGGRFDWTKASPLECPIDVVYDLQDALMKRFGDGEAISEILTSE